MLKTLDKTGERWEDRDAAGVSSTVAPLTDVPADEVSKIMAPTDSITGKAPAFQFYARDFAQGTISLSAEEVGVYIRLLCQQWDKGTLPSEIDRLARIAGIPIVRMRRLWPDLASYFVADPQHPGCLLNARLERERAKQAEFRRRQSDHGKRGGRPKGKPEEAKPNPSLSSGLSQTEAKAKPEQSSALCSLQSSDFSHKNVAREKADLTGLRAGDFIERYKALHVRLRKGAHYVGKPVFDYQEALQLAQVYDDARLDKLAFVWLNTDHDFAQNGTRTLAKFRSMVSWCEEQLIAWELKNGPLKVAS